MSSPHLLLARLNDNVLLKTYFNVTKAVSAICPPKGLKSGVDCASTFFPLCKEDCKFNLSIKSFNLLFFNLLVTTFGFTFKL